MTPEFIDGLPVHPLVVHFVVVFLTLGVFGSVLVALWPAARRRFGWLVVGIDAVAAVLCPVATDSGEQLKTRFPDEPLVARHQQLGDLLVWWALAQLVAVIALMVVHRVLDKRAAAEGGDSPDARPSRWPLVGAVAAAVLTVGLALGTGIHTYRVGDAGARAVWGDTENIPVEGGE